MAKFAATLGAKRALVLYDPADEFSKTLALAFGKQFKRKPDARIAGEAFAAGTVDFTKHLQTVKKKNPDVVYLPLPADQAAPILRKARELGLTMPFLGTANWDSLEFPLMVDLRMLFSVSPCHATRAFRRCPTICPFGRQPAERLALPYASGESPSDNLRSAMPEPGQQGAIVLLC
jgi:hypothetical protein